MTKIQPLFSWRTAVCESDLPATTRHVAITLSLYMSERGDSAYPGALRLARDTNLTVRCVRQQLAVLVRGGWLALIEKGGEKGDKRKANVYAARVPALELPLDGGTSFTREPHSPVNVETPTGEPDDTQRGNDVHPISSVELPKNSLPPSMQQTGAIVRRLAERDRDSVKNIRHPRAVLRACLHERETDGTWERVEALILKHPDWSNDAYVDAVLLSEVVDESDTKVRVDPDCATCDNSRWVAINEDTVDRCPSCWPLIIAGRKAS